MEMRTQGGEELVGDVSAHQHRTAAAHEETAEVAHSPAATYRSRQDQFAARRDHYNARRYIAANASVVLFFGAVAFTVAAFVIGSPLVGTLAAATAVGFVLAFRWQGLLDQAHRRYATLTALQEEGLARLRREWDAIPLPGLMAATAADPEHLAAGDIDLLGRASLQHLLSTASTPASHLRLRDWILAPAAPEVACQRQAAARELAPQIEVREELTLFGRLSGMTRPAYEQFLAWAERKPWLAERPWLIWLSRALPVLAVGSLVAEVAGLLRAPLWLLFIGCNLALTYRFGKRIEETLDEVSERQAVFQPYAAIFRLIEEQPFAAPLLARVQGDLAQEQVRADEQMRRLGRILVFGDLRRSLLVPLLQAFLLWNFHTLWLLEGWQRVAGQHVRRWLGRLAEVEVLAALGALSYDQPDWAYAEIVEGQTPLVAGINLGHPLLPPAVCVGNNVTVGPPGTLLLVTGSNMSGKSTLLRAIGVNVTLAQMGGPVCAEGLRLPPAALVTSMRISDSLEYGVSYFMAELRRLKQVVDEAQRAAQEGKWTPLFLLDEILHGTNTRERQIAVRRILRHLLALGATGAVSTHDLSLAEVPEIKAASHLVHFTEQFTRGPDGKLEMSFDYKLREGVATSTNALKLMEIVGLPVDAE